MLLTLQEKKKKQTKTIILTPENLFLFQSDCAVKILLPNIIFLLLPLFSRKVPEDDLNVT